LSKSTNIDVAQNIILERQLFSGHRLWVCNTQGDLDVLKNQVALTPAEIDKLNSIQYERRKREFLGVRNLVQQQFGKHEQIVYSETGKPMLKESGYCISISHSGDYEVVFVHPTDEVGVDIQVVTPKILKILKRFANEREFAHAEGDVWRSLVIWCAKEALFKWYANGEVDFRHELEVASFDLMEHGELKAWVKKSDPAKELTLRYEKLEDAMLVYTVNG